MQRIVGRKEQVSELLHSYNSGKSEFVVLYGRRRVGKTFLVNEVFGDKFSFSHSGLAPFEKSSSTMLHDQLQNFYFSLVRYGMVENSVPRTWLEAFEMLRRLLEKSDRFKRQVVFIDEMPWMDTPRSGFLAALEIFWNGWGCSRHNLMLIVCGSATSWIQNKLIDSRGGLYNRITNRIKVNAFTLLECEQLFSQMGLVLTRRDIVEAYMVTGGIPYYLSYFRKGLSLAQNIDRLFFAKEAKLSDEYSRLFSSLFVSPEEYEKIIEALSSRSYGLTRNEVSEKTGIANGGGLSLQLKALEESGFIKKYVPVGPCRKVVYYRVVDNFCLFWLKFKNGKQKKYGENFWQTNSNAPVLNAWRGIAFETVCFAHVQQIKEALKIGGISTEEYSWLYLSSEKGSGAQVDMIIDRADSIINVCEMKFCRGAFEIDKKYYVELDNKIAVVGQNMPKRTKAIHLTFITTSGVKQNAYSGIVQCSITIEDLFKE